MARSKPAEKKKAPRVVSGPTAPGVAHSTGETLGRVVRPLLPLLLLSLLYAVAAYLLWIPMRGDTRAHLTRETLLPPMLNAKGRPAGVSEGEIRKLAQLGLALEGRSVFESGLAQELARTYESSPWIERVGSIQVRYPATVRVEALRWRQPFARLDVDGGHAVLDRNGVVLPTQAEDLYITKGFNRLPGMIELPSLTGVACRKLDAGERVEERGVEEGLELLAAIAEALARVPGGLKASRAQRDSNGNWHVNLVLGPVLEWGCMNEENRPVHEPNLREKKEALVRRLSERGAVRLHSINLTESRAPVTPTN